MSSVKEKLLIVDDNYEMLDLVHRSVKNLQYHTYKASSAAEAIEFLKTNTIDLLITDLSMPEIDGIELLRYTEEHFPSISKLVMTGLPSIENAVNSLKSGALDYITKPFTTEELHKKIKESLLKSKNKLQLSDSIFTSERNRFGEINGKSQHFKDLINIIKRVKDNNVNVLIEGESGTGKELIARAIHYEGALAKMPFIAVNCGGIPENLIESELFGYVKGAFTGANENRTGLFQKAAGGTIFLDEIGNAPPAVQSKLLRVLQEKEITPLGSAVPQKIKVRIISATNNDLQQMVEKGDFREDLYYRINVINIKTSPLRERKEDILPLVDHFIKKYASEFDKPNITVDPKVLELLYRYSWPGNIRELENVIQHLIIMSDGIIHLQNVPHKLKYQIQAKAKELKSLKEYEKDLIIKVLSSVGNNKTKAAQILKIDRKTLNQKISEKNPE